MAVIRYWFITYARESAAGITYGNVITTDHPYDWLTDIRIKESAVKHTILFYRKVNAEDHKAAYRLGWVDEKLYVGHGISIRNEED